MRFRNVVTSDFLFGFDRYGLLREYFSSKGDFLMVCFAPLRGKSHLLSAGEHDLCVFRLVLTDDNC